MTTKFAYYPGCSSCSTGLAFEMSTQYMAKNIGLDLHEIPDWNCCGASSAHLINRDLSHALPARSLAISEQELPGLDVLTPCPACFEHLNVSAHYVRESTENREHIEGIIEREYRGDARVVSLLQAVYENEDIQSNIKERLVKSLNGLKVACYYGCFLVRPVKYTGFDDEENPQSMDDVMRLVGAEPIDWAFKTECCGASLQVTDPEAGLPLVERILRNAVANGAEAIVTACPMCQLNVDMRQKAINSKNGTDYDIPVYFFTELVSMCLGAAPKDVGIDKHYVAASAQAQHAVDTPPPAAEPEPDSKEAKIAAALAAKAAREKEKAEAAGEAVVEDDAAVESAVETMTATNESEDSGTDEQREAVTHE